MASFPQTDVAMNGIVVDSQPQKSSANMLQRANMDARGNLLIAQGMPPKADLVMRGYSFYKTTDVKVAVAALPTTTAGFLFINLGTRNVVVDRLSYMQSVARDTAGYCSVIANIKEAAVASQTATADTLTTVISLNCGTVNGGSASGVVSSHACASSATSGLWFWVCGQDAATATDIATGCGADINGLIVIPPNRSLALDLFATDATQQGAVTMFWHEVAA